MNKKFSPETPLQEWLDYQNNRKNYRDMSKEEKEQHLKNLQDYLGPGAVKSEEIEDSLKGYIKGKNDY